MALRLWAEMEFTTAPNKKESRRWCRHSLRLYEGKGGRGMTVRENGGVRGTGVKTSHFRHPLIPVTSTSRNLVHYFPLSVSLRLEVSTSRPLICLFQFTFRPLFSRFPYTSRPTDPTGVRFRDQTRAWEFQLPLLSKKFEQIKALHECKRVSTVSV